MNAMEILFGEFVDKEVDDTKATEKLCNAFCKSGDYKKDTKNEDLIADCVLAELKQGFIGGFRAAVQLLTAHQ